MPDGRDEAIVEAMTPPEQGAGRVLALLALLLAWVPWLGVALALLGFFVGSRAGRPRLWLGFALGLGILFTLAFHLLPTGSLEAGDPRLDLLEERIQPAGNPREIDRLP